jgi:AcrR family transcriptional regulator
VKNWHPGVVTSIQTPSNARSRSTRAALLDATRAVLEEGGLAGLTMTAVAQRAGVSRRAVYLHFASREELLVELFHHVGEIEGLAGSLQPVYDAPDAVSALDEWAAHLARFHTRIAAVSGAIERVRYSDPAAAAHWELVTRDRYRICHDLAVRLDGERRLAPPWTIESTADMLFALMSSGVLEALTIDRGWPPQRYRDHLALLFRSTFVRSESTSRSST